MTILATGGWSNSLLLLSNSPWFLLLWLILTASLACLVRGSLNFLVMFIFTFISSSPCSLCLCFYNSLLGLLFLKSAKCSAPLILAEREDSPSYIFTFPYSRQVSQSSLYPTLFELQGNLRFSDFSDSQMKHFFFSHFGLRKGSFCTKKWFNSVPPFSTICILFLLNLFNSSSRCFNYFDYRDK